MFKRIQNCMINCKGSNAVTDILVVSQHAILPLQHAGAECIFRGADLGASSRGKFSLALASQWYPTPLPDYCSKKDTYARPPRGSTQGWAHELRCPTSAQHKLWFVGWGTYTVSLSLDLDQETHSSGACWQSPCNHQERGNRHGMKLITW